MDLPKYKNTSRSIEQKRTHRSHTKVGELLKEAGFSLQSNSKRIEGNGHPYRNEQFMYINNKTENIYQTDSLQYQ